MPDVKICNLDLIAPIQKRELVLGGKTYEVEPLSVQMYIEFTQLRQKIGNDSGIEEGVALTKKMIKSAIPSMTDDVIDRLTLAHLQLIVAFINDEIPDEVLSGEALKKNEKEEEKEGATAENNQGN